MARFYADENFPLPVVEVLRKLGHDVLTVLEEGQAEQAIPDEEVLAFARGQNCTVVTLNHKHLSAYMQRTQPRGDHRLHLRS